MRKYSVILAAVMILAASCACTWAEVAIDWENFPDENFKTYIAQNCDTDGDGVLSDAEIAAITELNIAGMNIGSLQGIEFFVSLQSLDCSNNKLAVLDLSSNNALTHVNCDEQKLLGIAITDSGNTAYPYQANFTDFMTSEQAARISWVQGFIFTGQNATAEVATLYSDGVAIFASVPDFFGYYYPTDAISVQADMNVNIGNGVYIDEWYFPDETFRSYIAQNFDAYGGDGILFASEIAAADGVHVQDMGIKSLEGIRYLTSIKQLNCTNNSIESLDVHGLTELEYVWCANNNMKSLDVSGCTALRELHCQDNSILSFSIEGCYALEHFQARESGLTGTLDLHGRTSLVEVNCRSNTITSLDLSGCTALTTVYARDNQLQELNITGCNALEILNCQTSSSAGADHKNRITALDLSGKTKLKELLCQRNSITALDLTDCTSLVSVDCSMNQITSLNVAGCTALEYLVCGSNDIGTLDVSTNTKLTHLEAYACRLEELDLSNNTELEYLDLGAYFNDKETRNKIAALDLSNNTKLKTLECDNNDLTALDVSKLTQLERLVVAMNKLTSLDVSNNTALTYLQCRDNELTELDVSANTALTFLSCYSNDITTLDLSNNPLISELRTGISGIMAEVPELRLTYSPDVSMPYHTDMKDYIGSDYTNITSVMGYTSAGDAILTSYMADGTADFATMPVKVVYTYDTGYTGSADISADMKVALVPDPENFFSPLTVSVDVVSVVVSREIVTVRSREVVVSVERYPVPEPYPVPSKEIIVSPEYHTVIQKDKSSGCNALSGTMLLSLLTGLIGLITARKH